MNRLLLLTYMDVLETRNFNRTAERLNITQSTVSARIRQLEDELDVRLFERGRGGAAPTAAGRRFETHCRSFLAAWTMARRDLSTGNGTRRPNLRLQVQFSIAKPMLVEWAQAIREQEPLTNIYLESNFSEQIQRDILSGGSDLGIVYSPQTYPDISMTEIGVEYFVLLSTDSVTYDTLDWRRYIKVAYTSYFEHQHDALFPEMAQSPTTLGSEDLAAHFLRNEGGAAYMPSHAVPMLVQTVPGLVQVQGAPVIPQPVYSIVHSRKRHDRLTNMALAAFRKILQNQSKKSIDNTD